MAAIAGKTAAPGGSGYYAYSDPNSWQGGVVPGSGDSITTTQPVLIDADAAFGTNGASLTIDWAASAEVVVGASVTVTAKGDIRMANAPLTFRSGALWKLDGSGGPSAGTYRRIVLGSAILQANAKLQTDGVLSPRAQVESVLTGNGDRGQITGSQSNGNGRWDTVDGLNVVNLGKAGSRDAVVISPAATSAYHVRMRNVTFDACQSTATAESVSSAPLNISAVPDGADHELTNVRFTNSTSFRNMLVLGLAASGYASGTRTWTGCKFDKGVRVAVGKITATDCTFDSGSNSASFGLHTASSTNATEWVVTRAVVRDGIYALGSPTPMPSGTFTDIVFVRDTNATNPHYWSIMNGADTTIDGAIFWTNATDLSQPGDFLLFAATAPATLTRIVCRRLLSLFTAGGDAPGTITYFNPTGSATSNIEFTLEHSTLGASSTTNGGVSFGENGTVKAGTVKSVRSNIAYRPSTLAAGVCFLGTKHNNGVIEADAVVAMSHNAQSRSTSVTVLNAMPANAYVAGVDPEANKVVADAQFVDDTRNPLTADTALGGAGTLASLFSRLNAGTITPAQVFGHIAAGFVPQAASYGAAAHDGTTIGMAQMASAPLTAGALSAGSVTASTVDLTWTVATGGTGPYTYAVQYGVGASPSSWTTDASGLSGTNRTVGGLTASTLYAFRLVATDSAGTPATVTYAAVPATTAAGAGGAVGPAETLTTWDSGVPWDVSVLLSRAVVGQVFTVPTSTPTLTRVSFYLRAQGGTQPRYRLFVFAWGAGGATGAALHESAWLTTPVERTRHTRVDYQPAGGLLLTAGQQYVWVLSPVDSTGARGTLGDASVLLGAVRPSADAYAGGMAVTKPAPFATEGTRTGVPFSDLTDPNSPRAWDRLAVDLAFEMAFA